MKDSDLFKQFKEFKPRRGDLRRQKIINAIIDAIAQEGLHEFNSKTIAERAKMIRSHVVYYFPNYQSMIQAAVQFVVMTGQEITVAHLAVANTPEEKIEAWVEATFSWFERFPNHGPVMGLLYYLASCDPIFGDLYDKIKDAGRERIKLILLSGAKKKNDKLAFESAVRMRSMITGLLIDSFSGNKKDEYDSNKKLAKKILLSIAREFWK